MIDPEEAMTPNPGQPGVMFEVTLTIFEEGTVLTNFLDQIRGGGSDGYRDWVYDGIMPSFAHERIVDLVEQMVRNKGAVGFLRALADQVESQTFRSNWDLL